MTTIPQTTWKIFTETEQIWQELLKACEMARESIYIEQFLFYPDEIGKKFIDVFIRKAKEGVSVKCLFDSIQSLNFSSSLYVNQMRDAGVKIKFFNWLTPYSKHSKKLFYFRDHRRSLIIDRQTFYTGGICIGDRMKNWRETQIKVEGPVVEQANFVFDRTWNMVYKKHIKQLGTQKLTGLGGFSYITHAPLPGERHLYYRFVDALRGAQREIFITNPYFLPDNRVMRALILAKKRGVDVRVLVPHGSNHRFVDMAAATYYNRLLEKGIRIYRHPRMVHSKTVTVDRDWCMVGSLNMDNISLRYNFESAVISTVALCTDELRTIFMNDLNEAKEMTLDAWRQRPWLEKLGEKVMWPFRKFL
jgi:cardiolipin synthase